MHSQVSKSNLSFFISERRVDDDAGWSYLSFHDRRRTWATALACEDVDPLLVRDWDGWNDLETFLDHSRGTFSPDSAEAGARRRRVALIGRVQFDIQLRYPCLPLYPIHEVWLIVRHDRLL